METDVAISGRVVMDIDWSKAPEGATHWCTRDKMFKTLTAAQLQCCIPRPPTPAAPEWDGEGEMPPVGTAFEFSYNGVSWGERVMLFDDGVTCLMAHRKYPRNCWHYKSDDPDLRFRPIRTKEQRQREELKAVLKAFAEVLCVGKGYEKLEVEVDGQVDAILSRYNLEPKP